MPTTVHKWLLSFFTDNGRNVTINVNRADNTKTDPDTVQASMEAIRDTGVLQNVRDGVTGLLTDYRHAILRGTTRTPIN